MRVVLVFQICPAVNEIHSFASYLMYNNFHHSYSCGKSKLEMLEFPDLSFFTWSGHETSLGNGDKTSPLLPHSALSSNENSTVRFSDYSPPTHCTTYSLYRILNPSLRV